ncbi:transcriptional repressor LexA [Streptomyces sp. NBC_01142]|uniref:transcriptional repressor LexA n=1 Tax=Streptomyces sp. NBC_01142 TaxID=2975865 RepID=UPI002253AD65|nr:transcriptional repressor LexA [Streptomyces sp. NBC_01142]MCX4826700.1 transcriptional repressor LexA [Streptomyces sp. NBC_01142]
MEAVTTPSRSGRPPGIRTGDDGLTDRQRRVRKFIAESTEARGYPPSMREIGQAVGLSSTSSVAHQLTAMERKGVLRRDPQRPRAYVVVRAATSSTDASTIGPLPDVVHAPLVGRIAAGTPITAEQHVDDVYPLPRRIVGDGDLFILTVSGNSMIDAQITDGDQVVVRSQPDANNGDIVAAMIDGEATVKRFKRSGTDVWLMPENRDYQPICGREATILGKVTAVMRRV